MPVGRMIGKIQSAGKDCTGSVRPSVATRWIRPRASRHACLLAFKLTHGWGNSARSALAGKGAEARFALLCQCSLPTSSLRVLRSSLYCRLSSDLHSFRFCTSCAHVSWASRTSQGDRSSVVRHYHGYNSPGVHQGVYNAHHFSEERSLKGVLFPGSFTVSLVERGEGA